MVYSSIFRQDLWDDLALEQPHPKTKKNLRALRAFAVQNKTNRQDAKHAKKSGTRFTAPKPQSVSFFLIDPFPIRKKPKKPSRSLRLRGSKRGICPGTDGALVRVIMPVYPDEKPTDSEKWLKEFTTEMAPVLDGFLSS